MSKFMSLAAMATFSSLLFSCSQAQFFGTAPSKAQIPNKTNPDKSLSCSATPEAVKTGASAIIAIADATSETALFETILVGGTKTEATLAYDGKSWTKNDGGANSVDAKVEGTYTIELRRQANSDKADATCAFAASKDGTVTPPVTPPDVGTGSGSGSNPGSGSPVPPTPPCKDSEQSIGAHIAFLVDNSNSNAATDCPDAKKIGTFQNSDLYECGSETNREKAVLAANELLAAIAAKEPGNANATSTIAIASFPTHADFVAGFEKDTSGMLDVNGSSAAALTDAMAFSRKPFGLTPYGAAMSGATEMFQGLADDGKARVAVLVTDGEPTDQSPGSVLAKAQALAAQGIEVITVTYTGSETRAQRYAEHTAMMQSIDTASVNGGHGHWYDAAYASFAAYMSALIGNGGSEKPLVEKISSQVVEVKDSSALKNAFLNIIKTKAIKCER